MHRLSGFCITIMIVTGITLGCTSADAGFPFPPPLPGLPGAPNVSVRIDGFLPPPPGVHVQMDSGRPYYVERDRRVYMEREKPHRHYKKYKKRHNDHGRKRGHDRDDRHDRHYR